MYIPSNANVRYIMMMLFCSVRKKTTSVVHVSCHVNIGFKSNNSLYARETPRGSVADFHVSDPGSHGLWYAHAIAVTMPPCRLQEGVACVAVAGCMGGLSRQYQPWTTQLSHNRVAVHSWTPSWAHPPQDVPQEFLACQWVQGRRHTHRTGGWLLLQERERLSGSCCGHAGRLCCDADPFGGGSRSRGRNLQGSHGIGLCTERVRWQPDDGETLAAVAQKVMEIVPFRIIKILSISVAAKKPFFPQLFEQEHQVLSKFLNHLPVTWADWTGSTFPFAHVASFFRIRGGIPLSEHQATRLWLTRLVFAYRFVWK